MNPTIAHQMLVRQALANADVEWFADDGTFYAVLDDSDDSVIVDDTTSAIVTDG